MTPSRDFLGRFGKAEGLEEISANGRVVLRGVGGGADDRLEKVRLETF